jgi:hypothetical protein
MSLRCPSCKFESPDGALYCDFCKEPFVKKVKKAASPPAPLLADPLAGIPPEKVLDMPAADLLKADLPKTVEGPPWLRPLAWIFLVVWLVAGSLILRSTYRSYQVRQQSGPAPALRP